MGDIFTINYNYYCYDFIVFNLLYMSISITSYPVTTEAGQVLNAFVGFKPIELVFTRSAAEIAVECVLVDPNNENIDLLGFSLFADFNEFSNAIIDASIINDNSSQSVLLASQEVVNSRIKYKVKYREAGTTDAYVLIDGVIPPLIAMYSIADFALDKIITPIIEPFFWKGYPFTTGFIHSDANEVGLNIVVRYDLLDIQKAIISSDTLFFNYGANSYGLNAIVNSSEAGEVSTPFANAGAEGTTDWINSVDGVASFWRIGGDNVGSIVTGNGFLGNAQRSERAIISSALIFKNYPSVPTAGLTISFFFMYRSSKEFTLDVSGLVSGGDQIIFPANTGDAIQGEALNFSPLLNYLRPAFYHSVVDVIGDYLEIDNVYFSVQSPGGIDTGIAEYIDFKILSE